MRRLRVHVVYEHGPDLAPYGAAEVRLLRPLTHPSVKPWLDLSFGRVYDGGPVDALIVDRLVSPRLGVAELEGLIARARAAGAVLIHALDDDFLDLGLDRPHWADRGQARTLHRLLRAADGLLVTTERLAGRLASFSENIVVLPNALDERVLVVRDGGAPGLLGIAGDSGRAEAGPLALGYMGTFTHAEDLALVLPALRAVEARQPGRFELQVVGVADPARAAELLAGLPWRWIEVPPEAGAYPAFMRWFTGSLAWDLAIAPLADTPFTRCKSDLKHLDYAALGAAGIFSQVPAYSGTVRHAETGWLAPNQAGLWEAALERLLGDAALRARLAAGARDYLYAERTLATCGPRWVEAIHALVTQGRRARPMARDARVAPGTTPDRSDPPSRSLPKLPSLPALDRSSPPPRRLSVLYEYGQGQAYEPHASAHLRLIRPLTHPAAGAAFEPRFGPRFDDPGADLVILDRLWRPDVSMNQVEQLLGQVRAAGAKLVLALDDNLLDLRAERGDWPSEAHEAILRQLLAEADGLMVSGQPLAERLRPEAPRARMLLLPNALDERLLGRAAPPPMATPFGRRPLVIGYMGTATHDEDLALVLTALRAVCARHPGALRIELLGVLRRRASLAALEDLPLSIRRPHPADTEYTRFMPWFTGSVGWDIAIAPLLDTPFRRCKSDVKFLDGCAVGAAMVCSDVPAYAGTVRHGETGWLAENRADAWEEALETLIADAERRAEIALAGRRYLMAERTLARRAADWPAALSSLLEA